MLNDRIAAAVADTTFMATKFWPYTRREENGCLVWTRCLDAHGYGRVSLPCWRTAFTHRVAWAAAGRELVEGMHCCHHCDNPPCLDIGHLFLGTDADNQHDKWAKGRGNQPPLFRGETHKMSKFTTPQIIEVVRLLELGNQYADIELATGVSVATITKVRQGTNWKHIPRPTSWSSS